MVADFFTNSWKKSNENFQAIEWFLEEAEKIKWQLIYKHKTRVAKPALLLLLKVVTPLFNHYQIRNIKEGMDLLALVAEVFEL